MLGRGAVVEEREFVFVVGGGVGHVAPLQLQQLDGLDGARVT